MKFITGCLLSAFSAALFNKLSAQSVAPSISGKILIENQQPAETATIILLNNSDSTIINSTIIGKNGLFHFADLKPISYLLRVSKVGYNKSYNGPFQAVPGHAIVIPDIILIPDIKKLKEVSIISTRPDIEVKPGRIILNVQNSIMADGNSAFDILRQSPGVRVDNTNNISIVGKQSALIIIDGKPTNMSGDDLTGILKSMQSNTIERIELITAGSAKYDASSGGVINIILKKGKNVGANGSLTGSAAYGKYFKANTGIVFNDRFDKFNIYGNYNYSDNKTYHDFIKNRIINYNNQISNYHVDYNSIQKVYESTFSIGTDYSISPDHTIGFLIKGGTRKEDYTKNNSLKISNQGMLDSIITANSIVNRRINNINYNLNYSGKLDKAGKTLSADLNYTNYNRNSDEYITNNFYNAAGNTYRNPLLLQNISPSKINIRIAKIDFTDPLSKTSKLEAGIKYSNVKSNNNLVFGPFENGQYQSDPAVSNHFIYTENINAAYVSYENNFNKYAIIADLRAEQTIAKGNSVTLNQIANSKYLNLFPHVLLTYKYDEKHDFSISYNRGITRPSYAAVNPFRYYIDLYDYTEGNPKLKPEYSDNIELSYTYNKKFVTTLYSTIINDAYNFNYFIQNDSSKVSIDTRKNFGSIANYGIRFFAPAKFTNWWTADFSVDAAYQRYVSYPINGNLNKGTQDIIFTSTQHFIINKSFSAEITGFYESPTFYGLNQYKSNYHINLGFSKQIFNKSGSIRLGAFDIFNTLYDRVHTNYQNLNYSAIDRVESRYVRLTFTYRFGKRSVKAATIHNTGNDDEQNRTKPAVGN